MSESSLRYAIPKDWSDAQLEEWGQRVLRSRFETAVSVAHHRPVKNTKLLASVVPQSTRFMHACEWGFRFDAFSDLLDILSFWEMVWPHLKKQGLVTSSRGLGMSLFDRDLGVRVSALNGLPTLDYESLFAASMGFLPYIKHAKWSVPLDQANALSPEFPSSASVPDILTASVLASLCYHMLPYKVEEVFRHSCDILDNRIPNFARIKCYRWLCDLNFKYSLCEDYTHEGRFAGLLNRAADELSLPKDHPACFNSIEEVKERWGSGSIDAVTSLNHGDDGRNHYLAREVLMFAPDAYALATGAHSPHELKDGGKIVALATEAEETVAALTIKHYPDYFQDLSGMPRLVSYPPALRDRIVYADQQAGDTPGNALYVRKALEEIQKERKRPLKLLIVATDFHSARAYADFRNAIPEDLASDIGIYIYRGAPLLANIGSGRKVLGIMDMFCEYVKRFYMLATTA